MGQTGIERASTYLLIAVFCAQAGCDRPPRRMSPEDAGARLGELYQQYLRGTAAEAEQALLASVKVIDESDLDAAKKAHAHYTNCARLYVLYRKSDNVGEAEAYLAETHYWLLREQELKGLSKRDAGNWLRSHDDEGILTFVERWDQGKTAGQGPAYLRELVQRASEDARGPRSVSDGKPASTTSQPSP